MTVASKKLTDPDSDLPNDYRGGEAVCTPASAIDVALASNWRVVAELA
jgi:hypothetical protein